MKIGKFWTVVPLIAAGVSCSGGCATLINSDDQIVAFNSEPDGATVAVDGVPMGKTPVALPVARKGGSKMITFSKEGYKTINVELPNTLNAALAGNILFGGLIGLGVDAVSGRGGGYQKSLSVMLTKGSGMIELDPATGQPKAADPAAPQASTAPANTPAGASKPAATPPAAKSPNSLDL